MLNLGCIPHLHELFGSVDVSEALGVSYGCLGLPQHPVLAWSQ